MATVQNRPETGTHPGNGNYERPRERARTLAGIAPDTGDDHDDWIPYHMNDTDNARG